MMVKDRDLLNISFASEKLVPVGRASWKENNGPLCAGRRGASSECPSRLLCFPRNQLSSVLAE